MINKILEKIKIAEIEGLIDAKFYDTIEGFSGRKLIGSLQGISSLFGDDDSACYVEVGVFRGLTLLSTGSVSPKLSCYGIDNFAFFDPEKNNLGFVEEQLDENNLTNVKIINEDYEDALEKLNQFIGNKKIALYFIDGPHDYRSQLQCIIKALPYFHKNAVIIIDDCNYRHVRLANSDFLKSNNDWKLLYESYTSSHPKNMSKEDYEEARDGWWNGINIIVKDENDVLERIFPPTYRSRELYENENIVQTQRYAEIAAQTVDLFQGIFRFNVFLTAKYFAKLILDYFKNRKNFKGRYYRMNTYSANLTKSRYSGIKNESVNS